MSIYDTNIKNSLKILIESKKIYIHESDKEYFSALSEKYPASGSKIQWSKLLDRAEFKFNNDGELKNDILNSVSRIIEEKKLSGFVYYIGDSLTNICIEFNIKEISNILDALIDIPHHHYIISSDYSWCICLEMEGHVLFGRIADNK